MKPVNLALQESIRCKIRSYRRSSHLTQEKMAEILHVAARSYIDQEHGAYGFSVPSLLYFLRLLGDKEALEFLHKMNAIMEEEEMI